MMRRLVVLAATVGLLAAAGDAAEVDAASRTVRCGQGADLQASIDRARAGDTLVIRGRCVGQFVIGKDLRLEGAGPKAALQGTKDASQPLVRVGRRASVAIVDLRLTGVDSDSTVLDITGALDLMRSDIVGNTTQRATIVNAGTLKLNRSRVADNATRLYAIHNSGTLRILDSRIVRNRSEAGPGGIDNRGQTRIVRSTIARNSADFGCGGIASNGDLTIVASVLRSNWGDEGPGGNLCNSGPMVIEDSVIRDGGTVGAPPLWYDGPGGGGVWNWGEASIRRTVIRGGFAEMGWGGGIANVGVLTLADCDVSGNGRSAGGFYTPGGAGIWNGTTWFDRKYPGILRIYRTRIHDNVGTGNGGGILNEGTLRAHRVWIYRNSADAGGGIYNTGTAKLSKTWMWRNTPNDCSGC